MRGLILAPLVALFSSLTTYKIQEIRQQNDAGKFERMRAELQQQAAVAHAAGDGKAVEMTRLQENLLAAQERAANLEQQLSEAQARTHEATLELAALQKTAAKDTKAVPQQIVEAATTGVAGRTAMLTASSGSLYDVSSLVVDVILYAGGRDEMGRQRLESPVEAIANISGAVQQKFNEGVAAFKQHFPSIDQKVEATAEWIARKLVSLQEVCEASLGRFLDVYPQHKPLFASHSWVFVGGASIVIMFLVLLDIALVIWCGCLCCCSFYGRKGKKPTSGKSPKIQREKTPPPPQVRAATIAPVVVENGDAPATDPPSTPRKEAEPTSPADPPSASKKGKKGKK